MQSPLTIEEENFLKDILKEMGNNAKLAANMAKKLAISEDELNDRADVIFGKLQNGRLTTI